MPRKSQRKALVWYVQQAGLHKDHHSASHRSSAGDCFVVQLLYLPVPFGEGMGTEALNGSDSVEGHSLDSLRIRHHRTLVQKTQHQFKQGATYNLLNRPLMDSAVREYSCKSWPAIGAQTQTHTHAVWSKWYAMMNLLQPLDQPLKRGWVIGGSPGRA